MRIDARHIITLLLLTAGFSSAELTLDMIQEGLRKGSDAFEPIIVNKIHLPTPFNIQLGKSTTTVDGEYVFDGIRFTAPDNVEDKDFVWYFNAPANWGHWYILPVTGEPKEGFKNWLTADKVYTPYDEQAYTNRFRTLQTLEAGYFEAGIEYILWFRRLDQNENIDLLRGVLSFENTNEHWSYTDYEEVLKLEPMEPKYQVQQLDSSGGIIMLDKTLFDPGYAKRRIDNVFLV